MDLRRRVSRLEDIVGEIAPDECSWCHGAPVLAFPDDPDVGADRLPYRGGFCPRCHRPAPAMRIIALTPAQRRAFAAIPWPSEAQSRFRQKLSLIVAIWQ